MRSALASRQRALCLRSANSTSSTSAHCSPGMVTPLPPPALPLTLEQLLRSKQARHCLSSEWEASARVCSASNAR